MAVVANKWILRDVEDVLRAPDPDLRIQVSRATAS